MDLRIIKTHERLQQALLILLKEKSLDEISIAELSRLAKINRGTFYLHYKNVHGVFERYFSEIVEDLKRSFEHPYDLTNHNIAQLQPEMIQIFDHVQKYNSFYRIVFNEKVPLIYYKQLFQTLRSIMKEFVQGHAHNLTDLQLDYLLSYQTNAIIGILMQWDENDYDLPPQTMNEYLMQYIRMK